MPISNNTVLELTGMKRELLKIIRKRQMKVFGHIRRHESLEKLTVDILLENVLLEDSHT